MVSRWVGSGSFGMLPPLLLVLLGVLIAPGCQAATTVTFGVLCDSGGTSLLSSEASSAVTSLLTSSSTTSVTFTTTCLTTSATAAQLAAVAAAFVPPLTSTLSTQLLGWASSGVAVLP
eukprot:RCo053694